MDRTPARDPGQPDARAAILKDIIRSCGLGYERTQQPPAKAGGLGLRTENQDTRWLNNAS
jgi:hypothetical protein